MLALMQSRHDQRQYCRRHIQSLMLVIRHALLAQPIRFVPLLSAYTHKVFLFDAREQSSGAHELSVMAFVAPGLGLKMY